MRKRGARTKRANGRWTSISPSGNRLISRDDVAVQDHRLVVEVNRAIAKWNVEVAGGRARPAAAEIGAGGEEEVAVERAAVLPLRGFLVVEPERVPACALGQAPAQMRHG